VKRRAAAVATLALSSALGLATLTGCGAGQISQTDTQSSAVNGYQGRAGDIQVRDASFAYIGQAKSSAIYRAGTVADLNMTLVNVGATADQLVSVSSPIAAGGQVLGDAVIGGGRALQVGNGDSPSDAAALADKTISVKLFGLKQDITAGLNYPVVLTFQRGGVLNAEIPVGYPTGDLATRSSSN
jgi:periplasmic copper chaperone A